MSVKLTERVTVPEEALTVAFVRSPGPGGQNVNKVATAVQLRFDLRRAGLPADVEARLRDHARTRINKDDELLIFAHRYRSQTRNREDAMARLAAMIEQAEIAPKPQIKTRVPAAARRRRRDDKKRHGRLKQLRKTPDA